MEMFVKKGQKVVEWAFRSVVSLQEIKNGQIITQEMIWSKRPGTGIPSYRMKEVIGKEATRDIHANELIMWEDIK
jgi:N-acetylneuraminate synthase